MRSQLIKPDRRFIGRTFKNAQDDDLAYGAWYKFGPASIMRRGPGSYRLRLDATGEIVTPAGPAARDALMMALYTGETPLGYISYCFGPAVLERSA